MNLKLRDDNLYLTLHDHLTIYLPLKKRVKELEKALREIEKMPTNTLRMNDGVARMIARTVL